MFPPLLAEIPFAPIGFALGCGLLTAILLRRSYRYLGKRTRGGSGPAIDAQHRPANAWDGARHDAAARFDRQQVEMQELARELSGQLDSKMILLQELIAQSERQIVRLESLQGDKGMVEAPAETVGARAGDVAQAER